jgi:plasmid stabilization system protein ParE
MRWDERYRFFLLRKFPYYVAYRIEPDHIVVVAVFHTSRDSTAWTDR